MNPELLKKILAVIASGDQGAALELLNEIVAAEATDDPTDAPADPTAATADPPQPDPAAPAATSKDVDALNAKIAALEAKNVALDLSTRRGLVAELVKIGVETPATAWLKDKAGKATATPVARLMVESVDELRERVAQLRKSAPKRSTAPETDDETPAVEYSPAVKAQLAKMDPVQRDRFEKMQARSYAQRKGLRQ